MLFVYGPMHPASLAPRPKPKSKPGKSHLARTDGVLDNTQNVGMIANMPAAELITRFKNITPEGGVIELVVWRVPRPVPPTTHGFKYRAVYALDGVRVVGFDNEQGKGDHCHLDGVEVPYVFVSVERLVEDFIAAVQARRKAP